MAWSKPEYSRREVNRSGLALVDNNSTKSQMNHAYLVINNWRTSHHFPLNTFQIRLRRETKKIDENCLVAQRIKRMSSIKSKLERIRGLNLAQIQDIGGCRVIVNNMISLVRLFDIYVSKTSKGLTHNRTSRGLKHELFSVDDYVFDKPRFTGYRSIHLVYKYASDKSQVYNNLKIEIQLRTLLQHAWATAVETIDSFTNQSLKLGGGERDWKRFFSLISSVIALKEGTPIVPDTSDKYHELRLEIKELEKKLDVINMLKAFSVALKFTDDSDLGSQKLGFFILQLDTVKRVISIRSYPKGSKGLNQASEEYLELEKNNPSNEKNIVLVSSDTLETLKLTYPNYYADTTRFIYLLEETISGSQQLSLFD